MRVLIADDDEMNLMLLELALQQLGHEVIVARDGAQAWELIQAEEAPSLAILDWVMPGLEGTEICRRLRQQDRRPYQYLIMLTAKDNMDALVEGISSGADDFLRKPFDARELCARLAAGERLLKVQEELRTRAMFDELTGLLNRASVLERLQHHIDRGLRRAEATTIVLIDLDKFKCINDSHGHMVGDEVLRETARRLRANLRTYDELGRYGGEEFLLVLPDCELGPALQVSERMREALSTVPFMTTAGPMQLSASFGVATVCRSQYPSAQELLTRADIALYQAKRAGRNRVEGAVTGEHV
jgi:two-component system, cell cycle response regulator